MMVRPDVIEEFRVRKGSDEDYTVLHFPYSEPGGDVTAYNPTTQQATMRFKCHPEETVVLRVRKAIPNGPPELAAHTIIMGLFVDSEGARKYWWATVDRSKEGERNYAEAQKTNPHKATEQGEVARGLGGAQRAENPHDQNQNGEDSPDKAVRKRAQFADNFHK